MNVSNLTLYDGLDASIYSESMIYIEAFEQMQSYFQKIFVTIFILALITYLLLTFKPETMKFLKKIFPKKYEWGIFKKRSIDAEKIYLMLIHLLVTYIMFLAIESIFIKIAVLPPI